MRILYTEKTVFILNQDQEQSKDYFLLAGEITFAAPHMVTNYCYESRAIKICYFDLATVFASNVTGNQTD